MTPVHGANKLPEQATIEAVQADGTSIHSETWTNAGLQHLPQPLISHGGGLPTPKDLFAADWSDDWDYIEIIPRSGMIQIGAKLVVLQGLPTHQARARPTGMDQHGLEGGQSALPMDAPQDHPKEREAAPQGPHHMARQRPNLEHGTVKTRLFTTRGRFGPRRRTTNLTRTSVSSSNTA